MEKEAIPQKDAPPAQGGKRLNWRASAVDASVCGVVGNHSGRLLALGLGLGEVGPDQPEVVRAQVLARHCTARRSFDGKAVGWAWLPLGIPVLPLTNLGIALCPDSLCELGDRQRTGTG